MKLARAAISLAALLLTSGCVLFDDDFWDDYDSTYDSPSGEDCDCQAEFQGQTAAPHTPAVTHEAQRPSH